MSIRTKLILSFLSISLLGAGLGSIAIWSNKKLIEQLSFSEKPTRFAVHSAKQIGVHAKWAERHLYLYLTQQATENRDKFYERIAAIDEKIVFLQSTPLKLTGNSLVGSIKSKTQLLLSAGTKLLEIVDRLNRKSKPFDSSVYQDQIFEIHEIIHHIKYQALQLENLLADILNHEIEFSAANNIRQNTEESEVHLMLYLMMDDSVSRASFFSGIKSIESQIDLLKRYIESDESLKILQQMIENKQNFLHTGNLLLERYDTDGAPFSRANYHNEIAAFHQAATNLSSSGDAFENLKLKLEREPRETMLHQARVFNYTVFTIVCGAFALSILLGFWMAIGLTRSSKKLQHAAQLVGKGQLDVEVEINSHDEIGLLAKTFNQMIGDLKQTHQELDDRNKVLNLEIEKRKLIEKELQLQATTDPLTGILNRRAFFDKAGRELLRSIRYHRKVSVLMLDIDHFKTFNDTYGHQGGDEVLKQFAKEAATPLRTSDLIGRIGGEEFAIVLPETDGEKALKIAERIRQLIQKLDVIIAQQPAHPTVSIGVSEVQYQEKDISAALNRADIALYQAKDSGRNRVCSYINQATISNIHSL